MIRIACRLILPVTFILIAGFSFTACGHSDCHGSAPPVEPAEIDSILVVGQAFEFQFTTAFGGDEEWLVDGGDLPSGLSLDANGLLSGTPTLEGEYSFSIQANPPVSEDSECSQHPAHGDYTVVVEPVEIDGDD